MIKSAKTEGSGRKKGTPNKLTHETRIVLRQALAGELDKLPETLESLEPPQRIDVILKLLKYILPQIEAVTIDQVDAAALDPDYRKTCMERTIVADRADAKFVERLQHNLYPDT